LLLLTHRAQLARGEILAVVAGLETGNEKPGNAKEEHEKRKAWV
jgi:hypothetical protein